MLDIKTFMRAVAERPSWIFLPLFESGLLAWMPDQMYLKWEYHALTGKRLRLNPPQTFNEKIAWIKLHDRKPVYQKLADKYAVRPFIKEHLGEEWLVPLIGVWDNSEDIDYAMLPERFVLKCSHGYGSTVLCKNKADLDLAAVLKKFEKSMKTNYFTRSREWAYKGARPKIIAEALVDDHGGERPADYKFMCFNGRVRYVCISRGLGDFSKGSVSFFDADGNRMPFKRLDYPDYPGDFVLPKHFEQMKLAAEKLAENIRGPFVRVDFYEMAGHVYFSEFTFYPCGGTIFFDLPEYDEILGRELLLTDERQDVRITVEAASHL